MKTQEADNLKPGDKVIPKNGPYIQHSEVISVERRGRGVRWINYSWINPKGEKCWYSKRFNSVYLPQEATNV